MSRLNIILLIIIAAIAATASSALFIVNETQQALVIQFGEPKSCLLYTSPSPRDRTRSRMPSSA